MRRISCGLIPGKFQLTTFSWLGTQFPVGGALSIYKYDPKNVQENYGGGGSTQINTLLQQEGFAASENLASNIETLGATDEKAARRRGGKPACLPGRLHSHLHIQVASAAAAQHRNTFIFDAQRSSTLRSGRDVELVLAIECWDHDIGPQRRLWERDRDNAVKVFPLALKESVLLNA